MKETIVGGLVAGLVAGSMIVGAGALTRDGAGTPAQGGPVEVYGQVTIGSNPRSGVSQVPDGSLRHPFNIVSQAPDGSSDHPLSITQSGALYVKSCDGASSFDRTASAVCK